MVLVILCVVMLVGSYLAGSIPLVMKLSDEKLRLVTVLGAGLLVGTALTVIIPEGIRSLYMDIKPHDALAPASKVTVETSHTAAHSHAEENDHSSKIGLSLVLGFVFMMLVDQISQRRTNTSKGSDKHLTATIGLVVHAAVDGIALGAAATTSHQDVEMIVFLAIMLHKAPASFGLVSFLLHEKIERHHIRKHLMIFCLAAPVLTLLTYFCIGQEQKETLNSLNATGVAMLFSAGTFLYVATVHVLPELTQNGSHSHGGHFDYRPLDTGSAESQLPPKALSAAHSHSVGLSYTELIIMICGSLLPLIITFGHQH